MDYSDKEENEGVRIIINNHNIVRDSGNSKNENEGNAVKKIEDSVGKEKDRQKKDLIKKALGFIIGSVFVLGILCPLAVHYIPIWIDGYIEKKYIQWEDQVLGEMITKQLGKEKIKASDLDEYTNLKIFGKTITLNDKPQNVDEELMKTYNEIRTLADLKHFRKLESLTIIRGRISDITPLSELNGLTYLSLNFNEISDISPLKSMDNLVELYLLGNQISDISPIANLQKLEILNLNSNKYISNISPLAGLIRLRFLDLGGNKISDLGVLIDYSKASSKLENLAELLLAKNNISDLSPLSFFDSLTHLRLWANPITDISPIAELNKLTKLEIDRGDISNEQWAFVSHVQDVDGRPK